MFTEMMMSGSGGGTIKTVTVQKSSSPNTQQTITVDGLREIYDVYATSPKGVFFASNVNEPIIESRAFSLSISDNTLVFTHGSGWAYTETFTFYCTGI